MEVIKMFRRRIPQNFEYDVQEILDTIKAIVPNTKIELDNRGILTIYKVLTTTQKQALKTNIVPLLTDVPQINL